MPDFNGLGAFVAFLLGLADRVAAAEQIGRAAAVTTVRDEVVATLGEAAGGDTGPFPARPDLQAATQVARERRGLVADEPGLATGALLNSIRGSVEADGSAAVGVADAIVGSGAPGDPFRNIGDVAVAQEEGTGTVPQRSFLGIGGLPCGAGGRGCVRGAGDRSLGRRAAPQPTA